MNASSLADGSDGRDRLVHAAPASLGRRRFRHPGEPSAYDATQPTDLQFAARVLSSFARHSRLPSVPLHLQIMILSSKTLVAEWSSFCQQLPPFLGPRVLR